MKRYLLIAVLLLSSIGRAQELVTLTVPITHPNVASLRLSTMNVDYVAQSIYVVWISDNGESFSAAYTTPAPAGHLSQPTGAQILHTLNTTNFTSTSMSKKLFQELQADGYIAAGTIGGTAQ